jgi:hypothetical protein
MSKDSKDMRNRASRELRASRNGGSKEEKAKNVKRAAAYKQLAANEEWLQERSPAGNPSGRNASLTVSLFISDACTRTGNEQAGARCFLSS